MRPLYIFDLDGTLALIEHRRHFVERPDCPHCGWSKDCDHARNGTRPAFKPNWSAFFAACVDDEPNEPVINTLKALRKGAEIWIWSGRSDEVRQQTLTWLYRHGIIYPFWNPLNSLRAPEAFRMRPAGDFAPDEVLKGGWLGEMEPPERARLTAVFDDRDKVVKMWRSFGVACFQVAPGEF